MARDNFEACLAFTLKFEGGKVHDPHDPGGRTNQGVTQHVYDAWRDKWHRPRRDVYDMSEYERDRIYRTGYWDRAHCDDLPAGLDLCVFDYAVNSGPARALHQLQALDAIAIPARVHEYCRERLDFLKRLTTWDRYKNGWTARVRACEQVALQMMRID